MKKLVSIVVPTYNEIDNLQAIVEQINQTMNKKSYDYELIVVDDNSPDGTGILADKLAMLYKNLIVVHRTEKTGLGDAYKAGFAEAHGDIIFEMDCDFSHNPSDIPRFLKSLEKFDVIIGSRYVKKGRNVNRNLLRILISRVANILASAFFHLKLTDCTSGYRAYKRKVIDTIIPYVNCQKYTFQVEMLERAKTFNFKIREIPIVFQERRKGKSKFNYTEISEFLRELLKKVPIINKFIKVITPLPQIISSLLSME